MRFSMAFPSALRRAGGEPAGIAISAVILRVLVAWKQTT
jgi:hypothetical protein